jgi:quercetin dioxygenase-like cupin family protein
MAGIEAKSLSTPDEIRTPAKTEIDVVHVGATEVGRFKFEPGGKWSECIKPAVKTDSCQAEHLGTVISGRLRVVHNDGTQVDVSAGDAYFIAPGHDAWVLGDDAFVGIEFKSATAYATS